MRKLTRIGLLDAYADITTLDSGAYDPTVSMLPQASGGSNYTTVLDPVFTTAPVLSPAPAPAPVYTLNPAPAPLPAPMPAYDPVQAYTAPPAPATAPAGTIDPSAITDGTATTAPFNLGDFLKANPWMVGLGIGFVILVARKKHKKRKNAR